MIAIDTNVLARAFLHDDPEQTPLAQALMTRAAAGEGLYIPSIVLIEFVWVLTAHRQWTRADMAEALLDLLDTPGITIGQRDLVVGALDYYRAGRASFSDYYLFVESRSQGAQHLASSDRQLCKEMPLCVYPEALCG